MESNAAIGVVDFPSEYIKIKVWTVQFHTQYVNIPSFFLIMENASLLLLTLFLYKQSDLSGLLQVYM